MLDESSRELWKTDARLRMMAMLFSLSLAKFPPRQKKGTP